MYETFFGLKRRPFLFVPDVESYFSIESMEETRLKIERTVRKGEGISLIFGASGTGKTLLLRVLQQSLETEHASEHAVVFVSNSRLETPRDLFLQLFHDLRLSPSSGETLELRLQLLDFVRQHAPQGIILLFDDAQCLSSAVLEEIRLLSDTVDGSLPLFRVVLAGTLAFEEKLTFPDLETFNQRIAARCYLDSFSGDETSRYIAGQTDDIRIDPPHRTSPLFTEEAARRIYQLTDGMPRLINQLCSAALQSAAVRKINSIDGALINDAWSTLQHIETDGMTEPNAPVVQESAISPEQIEEIVGRKRKTFQLRQFNPVEFGTLTDSDAGETTVPETNQSLHVHDYKPPYPEDDDESDDWKDPAPEVYRLPHVQNQAPSRAEQTTVRRNNKACSSRRRRYLLEQIRCRLGLFAGVLRKVNYAEQSAAAHESNMNEKSLQEYGAAVLEGRPPFIRKEPRYAYQTADGGRQAADSRQQTAADADGVLYPDPKTGNPITLRWLPEKIGESERFGVSYTEFLHREQTKEQTKEPETQRSAVPGPEHSTVLEPERSTVPEPEHSTVLEPERSTIPRQIVQASLKNSTVFSFPSGLEESFDESAPVGGSAISLAELFRVDSRRIAESAEFKSLDETVQRQLEGIIRRIAKAAERIEQAAEASERAGRHVSQAAEFVETEVKAALPTYTDLFQQWSEFQNMISAELESARQRHAEPLKFQSFPPRRQVMIERTVPSITVEALLR